MAYSDPATSNQLTYLEALHRQLRGEVDPVAATGLNRGQASKMINEAKAELLKREHARLMAAGLPIPQEMKPKVVVPIPTQATDAWLEKRLEEGRRQRQEHAEWNRAKSAYERRWYTAAFGRPSRHDPPEYNGTSPIQMWMARPRFYDDWGNIHPAEWRWICHHESHIGKRPKMFMGGTIVGDWKGCLANAIRHYQRYHCDPRGRASE